MCTFARADDFVTALFRPALSVSEGMMSCEGIPALTLGAGYQRTRPLDTVLRLAAVLHTSMPPTERAPPYAEAPI